MRRAAGQFPDQPAIHRTEQDFAPARANARARRLIQNPFDLGPGKVSVRDQARRLPDVTGQALFLECVDDTGCAPALPDDRVIDRAACLPVPKNRGFTLVGDADGRDIARVHARLGDDLHHHRILRGVNLHGIVFDPPLPWVKLRKFFLRDACNILLMIEQDRARAGGALVERQNIFARIHSLRSASPRMGGAVSIITKKHGKTALTAYLPHPAPRRGPQR